MSYTQEELQGRDYYDFEMLGRLKAGVTPEQAQADVSAISGAMYSWMAEDRADLKVSAAVSRLQDLVVKNARSLLWLLLGAIFSVLLIACANLATLLLSRSTLRLREMAIRTALGATRRRLARLLLAEYVSLALMGGALGIVLARWIISAFVSILPDGFPRVAEIHMDQTVLGFAALLSIFTGVVFGTVPALMGSRVNLNNTLKEGHRSNADQGFWKYASSMIVVAQIALALVLSAGGSLLVRSFIRVQEVQTGMQSRNLLTMSVSLPQAQYTVPGQISSFYQELLNRIDHLPAVRTSSAATSLPFGSGWWRVFEAEGHPAPATSRMQLIANTAVLGDYFSALGIPLLRGRVFTRQDDAASTPVVIISEEMARQYWSGEDPVGKRLRFSPTLPWMTIVGVVGDVKEGSLEDETSPHTYQPYLQLDDGITTIGRSLRIAVRTNAAPLSLANSIRGQVQALDSQLPVSNLRSMDEIVNRSVAPRRFNTMLIVLFALAALLLVAAGTYGVVSYAVRQRTQEIGLRMALGAQRGGIVMLVLKDGLRLALVGIGVGLPLAFIMIRLFAGLVFGISVTDPVTFIVAVCTLVIVTILACFMPARRAMKFDPIAALRHE
jgi:putative ABC transport system permease protein